MFNGGRVETVPNLFATWASYSSWVGFDTSFGTMKHGIAEVGKVLPVCNFSILAKRNSQFDLRSFLLLGDVRS